MLNTSSGFAGLVGSIVAIFNVLLPALAAAALVLFFIGIIKYIRHEGEQENRTVMLWSLVVLFVMLSMWGILRLMCSTLTGTGSCASAGGGSPTGGLPASYGGTGTNLW